MKKLAGMVAAVVVIAAVAVMWKGKTRGSEGDSEGATRNEKIAATSARGEDAEARGEVPAPAERAVVNRCGNASQATWLWGAFRGRPSANSVPAATSVSRCTLS